MGFLDENKKEKLHDFAKFVKKELGLKKTPTIAIQNGREGLKTTANYDYTKEDKIIKVCGKNRALVDIMRSLGHEMTHHKQFEDGRLTDSKKDGADGSDIENEAHAMAGLLIRKYGNLNKDIYEDID